MGKIVSALLLAVLPPCPTGVAQQPSFRSHSPLYGLWLHPGDAGRNPAEVAAFLDKARDAHINTIVLSVKSERKLFYASRLFPEDVDPEYRNSDLLHAGTTEAHKRGMKVHAWLVDFVQGPDGYAIHKLMCRQNTSARESAEQKCRPSPRILC
jgi:uncharacterized lipoprotein YddW (UPF0748 family)